MFILSNTRAVDAQDAAAITGEICRNLKQALRGFSQPVLYVSRSDSTLRGHYPLETDIMEEALGPFDAHFLVPAFFEGGRFTVDGVHFLAVGDSAVPVHETEFAQDAVFGYHHSYLPDYVEEKTRGRIRADQVQLFRSNEPRDILLGHLLSLRDNACCVVDAKNQSDLNLFAAELHKAAQRGKRFLFRSAASLLTALAQLPPQPLGAEAMSRYTRDGKPGVVLVGSHVQRTSTQLDALLREPATAPVLVDVARLPQDHQVLLEAKCKEVADIHASGRTPIIFTSRKERRFADKGQRLRFGQTVSAFLVDLVRSLPPTIGYLISKGGVTTNDVLSDGLRLRASRLVGQVSGGVSVVLTPADHGRFPKLPVVIFPGNVGDDSALVEVYQRLSGSH